MIAIWVSGLFLIIFKFSLLDYYRKLIIHALPSRIKVLRIVNYLFFRKKSALSYNFDYLRVIFIIKLNRGCIYLYKTQI